DVAPNGQDSDSLATVLAAVHPLIVKGTDRFGGALPAGEMIRISKRTDSSQPMNRSLFWTDGYNVQLENLQLEIEGVGPHSMSNLKTFSWKLKGWDLIQEWS
ncbi:MAG: hypothetical protein KDD55_07810, partial [Bdellovibrionales bacterium]|nr:hypothetical protein [Bdellovibrionales bacterium]